MCVNETNMKNLVGILLLGLGLSLSYDIVKAHGGELRVETVEGEGTTFFIVIPENK